MEPLERVAEADRALSVRAAAAEQPDRVFLVDADGDLTFAQAAAALPEATGEGPWPLVASASRLSVLAMLAAMEARRPLVPLHPRWSDVERAQVLARVASSSRLGPAHLAVLFTSGTSGTPKGALLSRAAFVHAAAASAERLGWREGDRWLLAMPLAHVGGLSVLVRALVARRSIVIGPPGPFDARALHRCVHEREVTLLSLVPTQLAQLVREGLSAPAFVRAVLLGGAGCPSELLERAVALGWPLHTTYGLTEMCAQVATSRRPVRNADEGVGEPLEGVVVQIREGRVHVCSPSRMDGWLDAPTDSAPRSPFDDEGFYDTGDLGWLDAHGRLHVSARREDLIVTGGENVYPAEVEQALEALDGVEAACVVGVPDALWGQRVAAAIVGVGLGSDEALRDALRVRLAGFKLPRLFVRLEALPTNANGKLDRKRVRELVGAKA